ncbi:hypothetical protein I302_102368 [Kwoniella bestiolae CBS 10118]|uniref:Uncharacterized protein n=1 Tax=Kwoniella bestiolae CBS 10118 TaxID=1296100 RepID=A0A1B9GEZ5_9TREE|nr:hypothetical protein I302_01059 [Kwoniella bestiolae CBS 10118]OCF29551.1 hypothetical protein I302_01059 [Kwoniella bestiolae CBS 10118]
MFTSTKRTLSLLLRTPLIPPPQGPAAVELSTFTPTPGPSRTNNRRTISNMSIRGYASDRGKQELYSDEGGSTGAGTDDVAHTDAAFNKDPNPASSAKQVENESGKDFTKNSSANPSYSYSPGKQGEKGSEAPLNTSKEEAKKNQ